MTTQDGNAPTGDVDTSAAEDHAAMREAIIERLRTVYDPEIPVSIYDLGLIYKIDIDDAGKVDIVMTLTAPACPVADTLPIEVAEKARAVDGVAEVKVDLVWDPPWTPDMMSEAARLELGMF